MHKKKFYRLLSPGSTIDAQRIVGPYRHMHCRTAITNLVYCVCGVWIGPHKGSRHPTRAPMAGGYCVQGHTWLPYRGTIPTVVTEDGTGCIAKRGAEDPVRDPRKRRRTDAASPAKVVEVVDEGNGVYDEGSQDLTYGCVLCCVVLHLLVHMCGV